MPIIVISARSEGQMLEALMQVQMIILQNRFPWRNCLRVFVLRKGDLQ